MDALHIFQGNLRAILLADEWADVLEGLADEDHEAVVGEALTGEGREAFGEKIQKRGLVEEFGAVGGVGLANDGGEDFGAANPTAHADELGEFVIAEFLHGAPHILECPVEFLANGLPILGVGFVGDAFGTLEHGFFHIDGLGEGEDAAADFLHALGILGLNGDETLGDDGAEEEGDLGALGGLLAEVLALLSAPVRVAEFVEHGEDLAGDRDDDIIDRLGRKLGKVDGFGRLLSLANAGQRRGGEHRGNQFW